MDHKIGATLMSMPLKSNGSLGFQLNIFSFSLPALLLMLVSDAPAEVAEQHPPFYLIWF